ncbi:MAG: hypothetical protein JWO95_1750 [Verrucomicrobiales bacterium]|nr:hypothetical protein [Verrucomicrobiales bacterium]
MRKLLRTFRTKYCKLALLAGLASLTGSANAETPEHFAQRFATFKFEFHAEIQDPTVFLKTKKGDCDDFAILADDVLTRQGYTTHLISVRMPGETHVVLYVDEAKGYLDYNFRSVKHPCLRSDNCLQHIAAQVASSFNLPWVAVYEFNYHHQMKHLVSDIVMNDKVDPSPNSPIQLAAAGSQHPK